MNEPARKCPTAETLASFIDGTLSADERQSVMDHVAECRDCYEVVAVTGGMEEEEEVAPPRVAVSRWGLLGAIAAAAAMAGSVFIFAKPSYVRLAVEFFMRLNERAASVVTEKVEVDPLKPVIEASARLQNRTVEGRLDGFPYAEYSVKRGNPSEDTDINQLVVEGHAGEVAGKKGDSAKMRHARGVAELLLKQAGPAVEELQAAANADPSNARYWNDLAVARLAEASGAKDVEQTPILEQARIAAERALQLDPKFAPAQFNLALALDKLKSSEAIAAYERYLELDRSSKWSNDATRYRDRLKEPIP